MNIDHAYLSNWFSSQRHQWHPSSLREVNPIEKLGKTGLSILSAPDIKSALWSFREKSHLEKMLVELKQEYDCIIIDVPSLLENNDEYNIPSETICSICDKTLLMVLSADTSEGDVTQTLSILKKSGSKVHGIVMNDLHEPCLKDEICREVRRIEKYVPKLSKWIKNIVRNSAFLSQEI
jgi:Mrp family chromosome partitioning ATPase